EVESLARGYGSTSALAQLRAGQSAVRRLQLTAIWRPSGALPDKVRTRLDAAFGLLEKIARRHPEQAASLLRHPFLGTWAVACLARLESGSVRDGSVRDVPADVEFGYLSGLAAA